MAGGHLAGDKSAAADLGAWPGPDDQVAARAVVHAEPGPDGQREDDQGQLDRDHVRGRLLQGLVYDDTIQMEVNQACDRMKGKWLGFGRDPGEINTCQSEPVGCYSTLRARLLFRGPYWT